MNENFSKQNDMVRRRTDTHTGRNGSLLYRQVALTIILIRLLQSLIF